MTFTYSRMTRHGEYDFEYSPERLDVMFALAEILVDESKKEPLSDKEYKVALAVTKKMIDDLDLQSELEEMYRDELKEYFKDEALESESGD